MSREKSPWPQPPAFEGAITLPLQDYERMRRLSIAAERAYMALNAKHVPSEDFSEVVWMLFRAIEGGMPVDIQ